MGAGFYALRTRGIEKGVAEIITQVVVDHGDLKYHGLFLNWN
jgi:carbamate kinase